MRGFHSRALACCIAMLAPAVASAQPQGAGLSPQPLSTQAANLRCSAAYSLSHPS